MTIFDIVAIVVLLVITFDIVTIEISLMLFVLVVNEEEQTLGGREIISSSNLSKN